MDSERLKQGISVFVFAFPLFLSLVYVAGLVVSFLPVTGHHAWCLAGTSMEPYAHAGDLVITSDSVEPAIGDNVVFEHDGSMVFHRVVDESLAESGGYITRGDNNPVEDGWIVEHHDLRGVETTLFPRLGFLVMNRSMCLAMVCACGWLATVGAIMLAFAFGKVRRVRGCTA